MGEDYDVVPVLVGCVFGQFEVVLYPVDVPQQINGLAARVLARPALLPLEHRPWLNKPDAIAPF